MEIQIFGGIKEIGGNKVFINVGDKNFLFDFGLSFKDNNQYFSGFLGPRKFNGIVDYLYLGLIPSINKLYRNDNISPFSEVLSREPYKITPIDENMVDAFFLSHAHMDHYKFIGFLKKDTPIYLNWISNTLIDYISENSMDPLVSEILNYHEFHKKVPKKNQKKGEEIQYKRATKNDFSEADINRKIMTMKEENPYSFKTSDGEVNITQYIVDHSIPGACAYIIENDGRSIVYTGDFRRHGFHGDWVDKFIDIAHKSNPIAIITEGTRVTSKDEFKDGSYKGDDQSEKDVQVRSRDMIRRHPGLILVNFPSRNLDRILLYYRLAKRFNRVFAITPKIYLLIDSFRNALGDMDENIVKNFCNAYNLPEFNDENFTIYLPRKGWGNFESADYRTSEKKIFNELKYVTYKDVQKEPERYMAYLDFYMVCELIDMNQKHNDVMYINSTTDPFNEELELQEEKLDFWLDRFGVLKTETIHSSGHCNVDDLIDALQKIDAENIIPVHTPHPETFKEFGLSGKIIMPEKSEKYVF